MTRHDIAFKLLAVDQGPMVYNLDQVLVTRDHGSVHVPLGDQGSGRGLLWSASWVSMVNF